jgi:hypothetical protein
MENILTTAKKGKVGALTFTAFFGILGITVN